MNSLSTCSRAADRQQANMHDYISNRGGKGARQTRSNKIAFPITKILKSFAVLIWTFVLFELFFEINLNARRQMNEVEVGHTNAFHVKFTRIRKEIGSKTVLLCIHHIMYSLPISYTARQEPCSVGCRSVSQCPVRFIISGTNRKVVICNMDRC